MQNVKIISAKCAQRYFDFSEYEYIFVDEAHRLHNAAYDAIIAAVSGSDKFCFWSLDANQTLSQAEQQRDISSQIDQLTSLKSFRLTQKIRTNQEMANFIQLLLDLRDTRHFQEYPNVSLVYAGTVVEAKEILNYYRRQNYTFINYMVGWISIAGTTINYPVMQSRNNPNFYLKHNFEKEYSDLGTPYVQENCDIAESDNLVIYGHHIKGGKMFGALEDYKSKSFYEEHKSVQFDTLTEQAEYEIVAVFKTVAYSSDGFRYYDFVDAENEEEFNSYVGKCKELALYDTGVTAEYGDRLITLSTCEYSAQNGRLVVVAKKVG